MTTPRSAVFDCNIFLQSMLSTRGPSYACWQKVVEAEVALFISPYILAEIRKLPAHKSLNRFPAFTAERVERFIEELLDVAELITDPAPQFRYARDPNDTAYVDLAIITGAKVIVSNDKDLLDLMNDTNIEGRALRALHPEFRHCLPRSSSLLCVERDKSNHVHYGMTLLFARLITWRPIVAQPNTVESIPA